MTCQEALAYVEPYLDGELSVSETAAVDAHVATCEDCTRLVARQRAWREVVQQAPRFRAPQALADRIRAATTPGASAFTTTSGGITPGATTLGPAAAAAAPTAAAPAMVASVPVAKPRWTSIAPWLAAAAAVLLGAALTFGFWTTHQRTSAVDLVAHDIIGSHIRSLMGAHLTDVPSSDRHTVKPWFAGRVPYSLNVPDLSAQGFVLDGGRLDFVSSRPVAALVYHRNKHVINLFVWPMTAADRAANETRNNFGYEAIAWTAARQQYWAVSDLNDAELRAFVSLLQQESR